MVEAVKDEIGGMAYKENLQRYLSVKVLVAVLVAFCICYVYLPCVLLVAYNYIWWILFSGTVRLAEPSSDASAVNLVPKILHQTWKDQHIPEKWRAAQASCVAAHPGYEYKLWTDASAEQFIGEKFPWFLDTYRAYPYNIQRADVLRYFVLYEYGGIYLDLDVECVKSLDAFRNTNFTAPKTYPIGVSNDVMISKPKDAFAHQLIHHLAGWQKWLFVRYVTVMFTTGPMFVTVQYALSSHKRDITVLPADVYGKYNITSSAHLKHLHGSSWHGNDASYIFWLEHYGIKTLAVVGLLAVTAVTGALYLRYRKGQQAATAGGAMAGKGDGWQHHVINVLDTKWWTASGAPVRHVTANATGSNYRISTPGRRD